MSAGSTTRDFVGYYLSIFGKNVFEENYERLMGANLGAEFTFQALSSED